MNIQQEKRVIVVRENLPLGIIANTAAILGVTLGMKMPEVVGREVADRRGGLHSGIIQFPIPILRGSARALKNIRERLNKPPFSRLTAVDFSDLAQSCKTYDEFICKMAEAEEADLEYYGIALRGDKKRVNRLTGNLPLLR